jgi:hypothetical protein
MDADHPALLYDRPVAELRTRARLAVGVLAVTLLARGWDVGARQWSIGLLQTLLTSGDPVQRATQSQLELADRLVNLGAGVIGPAFLVTAILFLRWVHALVKLTRQLGVDGLAWTPSQAVWGFIIPVVSFIRPYKVLRDVQQGLDPDEIAPPPPRVDRDVQAGYRGVTFEVPPSPSRLPSSFLGAWWGSFMFGSVVARIASASSNVDKSGNRIESLVTSYHVAMFSSAVLVVAAAFAILVVRSLTARLEERFRRIRHSTPESLSAQGIALGDPRGRGV